MFPTLRTALCYDKLYGTGMALHSVTFDHRQIVLIGCTV